MSTVNNSASAANLDPVDKILYMVSQENYMVSQENSSTTSYR